MRQDSEGRWEGLDPRELETQDIDPTTENCAVLSWRAYFNSSKSLNLTRAVLAAHSLRIPYLLLDKVSVNQDQAGDSLISDVVQFSDLYSTIPVICAYDNEGYSDNRVFNDWHMRMYRPWIFRECMSLYRNPTMIHYIGSDLHQGIENFPFRMKRLHESKFLKPLMHLLYRDFDIAAPSDLQYMVPKYRLAVKQASVTLSDADFFFFCFIAEMQPHRSVTVSESEGRLSGQLDGQGFVRFRFELDGVEEAERPFAGDVHEVPVYRILFDDREIGSYKYLRWIAIASLDYETKHWISFKDDVLAILLEGIGVKDRTTDDVPHSLNYNVSGFVLPPDQMAATLLIGQLFRDKISWQSGADRMQATDRIE